MGKQVSQLESRLSRESELRKQAERSLSDGSAEVSTAAALAKRPSEIKANMPLWVAGSAVVFDPKRCREAWGASRKLHAFLKELPDGPDVPEQPIASCATFSIHLVVNGEKGPGFELEPGDKGLYTAAMHYFALDRRPVAAVDFARTPPPGSSSSNLVCEMVLQMPPGTAPYVAQGKGPEHSLRRK
jgi:hypothetical protein